MRKLVFLVLFFLLIIVINCTGTEEEPFISHVYGYTNFIRISQDTIHDTLPGVNGLILRIYDIDPYNIPEGRLRYDTTETRDSIPGCFEMDSVCYGTTSNQGNIVSIGYDATENPGYSTTYLRPYISGDIDTINLYFTIIID